MSQYWIFGVNTLFMSTREKPEFPHQYDVPWSVLDDTKQAQDDHNDVEEVDHDGSPLVAQEVKHLPLQCTDLQESTGIRKQSLFMINRSHSLSFFFFLSESCKVVIAAAPPGTKHAGKPGYSEYHLRSGPLQSEGRGVGWETQRTKTKWVQLFIVVLVLVSTWCFLLATINFILALV